MVSPEVISQIAPAKVMLPLFALSPPSACSSVSSHLSGSYCLVRQRVLVTMYRMEIIRKG